MTNKFVTRALLVVGLFAIAATASFAQGTPCVSKVRRVSMEREQLQPVAASSVIMTSKLALTADQKAKVSALNSEVANLQAERARLWSEYRAIKSRPNFDDNMAEKEAAPRMHRIVEINAQLAPIVARQETALASILTSSQRAEVAKMVASTKAGL